MPSFSNCIPVQGQIFFLCFNQTTYCKQLNAEANTRTQLYASENPVIFCKPDNGETCKTVKRCHSSY